MEQRPEQTQEITAEQLSALPHRVEFTEDVIARVRGSLDE